MKIIRLSHRTIITRARDFHEFRVLQSKNYKGNSLLKFARMWMDWQEIKDVLTSTTTNR